MIAAGVVNMAQRVRTNSHNSNLRGASKANLDWHHLADQGRDPARKSKETGPLRREHGSCGCEFAISENALVRNTSLPQPPVHLAINKRLQFPCHEDGSHILYSTVHALFSAIVSTKD